MSGHSKWHNIQAKKGKADAARGKIFTKLGRELLIAVKEGGPDPAGNSKLKNVIAKCKAANMPNDTINNAIKKASTSNENYEEITYEGYGPNGVAVIVQASTDNKNRTAADVRHVFDKAGGNLGTTGCVSYMFNKKGVIVIEKETTSMSEDDLMMLALDAGAEDFSSEDEIYEITTDPADFSAVREKLEEAGLEFLEAEVQMVPTTTVKLDEKGTEKMERLLISSSKISYYLLWFIGLPVMLEIGFILNIWLVNVPDYTELFTKLIFVEALLSALSAPIITSLLSTGKIKWYQIVVGSVMLINVPISYLLYRTGMPVYTPFVVSIVISWISFVLRLYFCKSIIGFSVTKYLNSVLRPVLMVTSLSLILPFACTMLLDNNVIRFIIVLVVSSLSIFLAVCVIGLTEAERLYAKSIINSKLSKTL